MKLSLAILFVGACTLLAQAQHSAKANSAELLFSDSNSSAALKQSGIELKRDPRDLNARFVQMEAARLQLLCPQELSSAVTLLRESHGADPRARLAAEHIRELAADTPQFRSFVPRIMELIRRAGPYSRELSIAMLAAREDGILLPETTHLTPRITRWQIAGPFGELANVDFDQTWPPEHDALGAAAYGQRVREDVENESGELQLPDYFAHSGIYFAAANLPVSTSGRYRFTVEGDGTFELSLDGHKLLLHDARFHSQNATDRVETSITAGQHRVLLKLQYAALPLQVWIEPARKFRENPEEFPGAEQRYLDAASALVDGNAEPALALDQSAGSITELLKADALSSVGEDQQSQAALSASVTKDSGNLFAVFQLAKNAFGAEHYEEAASNLGRVLKSDSSYWPAQEMKYQLAVHFDWAQEREEALQARLRIHPSCSALIDAGTYSDDRGEAGQSAEYEARLGTCSRAPYQYWEQLSHRGRHQQTEALIGKYLEKHPLDRHARMLAIRESVLARDNGSARRYVESLKRIAPNWKRVETVVDNPQAILDAGSSAREDDFYLPFVRDARPWMSDPNRSQFDRRILLNDRTVKLDASGGAWTYQHTVTQVFDKRGIELSGEVVLPRSVDLLELRTLKRSGESIEPEINGNKTTVSMPSLEIGDAVEIAWLQHFNAEELAASPELLDFFFGSSDSPTRSSRLTILRNGATEPLLWPSPDVKQTHADRASNSESTWEVSDIGAPPEEPSAPAYEKRPRMLWLAMGRDHPPDAVAHLRDELIRTTQITPSVEAVARRLQGSHAQEKVAAAYRYVMTAVENQQQNWRDGSSLSADDTLLQREGNRAAALIALLTAIGINADLELAAERSNYDPSNPCAGSRCYTHPLVRVTMPGGKSLLLDPEADGMAAGALSPQVEDEPALLICRLRGSNGELVSVPHSSDQKSVANAELQLDDYGDIEGTIHVQFGSFRGAQMRQTLRQLSAKDRQDYFGEVAGRILPNVGEVTGSIRHEEDPEQPLELELKAKAPGFARWDGGELAISQLIPALGLSRLYGTLQQRTENLLIDAPLIESSEFLLRMPAGVEPSILPRAVDVKTKFGVYHTAFKSEGRDLRIVRSFRIPQKVVTASDYAAFSEFAQQIDSAERELIQLHRTPVQQAHGGSPTSVHNCNRIEACR